jgi:hypothetical protein
MAKEGAIWPFFLKNNGSYMTVINFFVYLCKELAMPFLIYYQDV